MMFPLTPLDIGTFFLLFLCSLLTLLFCHFLVFRDLKIAFPLRLNILFYFIRHICFLLLLIFCLVVILIPDLTLSSRNHIIPPRFASFHSTFYFLPLFALYSFNLLCLLSLFEYIMFKK